MDDDRSIWDRWQELLRAERPDLLEILKLGVQLQAYFAAVERETLKVAQATGITWAQLGEALGASRRAVWRRATTRAAVPPTLSSEPPPFVDEDRYADLRSAMEEIAARTDQMAGEMFDAPRRTRVIRKNRTT